MQEIGSGALTMEVLMEARAELERTKRQLQVLNSCRLRMLQRLSSQQDNR